MIDLDKLSDEEIATMAEEEGIALTAPTTAPETDSSETSIDLDALSDEDLLDMLKEEGIETDLTPSNGSQQVIKASSNSTMTDMFKAWLL